jgi:hypothetical protein
MIISDFMEIKEELTQFIQGNGKNKGRQPQERYSSFDYCYNYFYSFYKEKRIPELANEENMQMSCLQIGFYLASWGMMRGSSFLLEKSVKNYEELIRTISKSDPNLWEIDVDNYNENNIKLLLNCKNDIIGALGKENNPTDTLVTKIMLGVFANVPAFDKYFSMGFRMYTFNEKSLLKLKEFYYIHKSIFDSYEIHTFDFITSKEIDINYTRAKLIDMYGFIKGQK